VWRVPADFATVPEAVYAATDGDEIRVRSDYHTDEAIGVWADLHIVSYDATYSQPEPGATVKQFVCRADLTIEGFSMVDYGYYGAFALYEPVTATLRNCTIRNGNTGTDTGAVWAKTDSTSPATLILDQCTIRDHYGYVFYFHGQDISPYDFQVLDCEIANVAFGMYFRDIASFTNVTMENSTFSDEEDSEYNGNNFYFKGGDTATNISVTVRQCRFKSTFLDFSFPTGTDNVVTVENCLFDMAHHLDTPVGGTHGTYNYYHNTFAKREYGTSGIFQENGGQTVNIINNIFYNCLSGVSCAESSPPLLGTRDYNIFHEYLYDYFNTSGGPHDQTVDPLFVSTTNFDYHLASPSSPPVEAGLDVGLTVDLDGNARPDPVGSAPDIGCYEYSASYQTPTHTPVPTYTPEPTGTPGPSGLEEWTVYR